jgi:Ca2+-binding RTX toxin-like protein
LTVDASALGSGDSLFFNGSAETDGRFVLIGGGGGDRLIGGDGNDVITGGLGADVLAGEGGRNVFNYASAAESTGATFDTLAAFNIGSTDTIHLPFIPGAVDAAVTTGALSRATFDANLASAIGAGQLGVGAAVVFTPDSGDLATHHFLIVEANGIAGYQAGQDYVIQLGAGSDLAITTATFT